MTRHPSSASRLLVWVAALAAGGVALMWVATPERTGPAPEAATPGVLQADAAVVAEPHLPLGVDERSVVTPSAPGAARRLAPAGIEIGEPLEDLGLVIPSVESLPPGARQLERAVPWPSVVDDPTEATQLARLFLRAPVADRAVTSFLMAAFVEDDSLAKEFGVMAAEWQDDDAAFEGALAVKDWVTREWDGDTTRLHVFVAGRVVVVTWRERYTSEVAADFIVDHVRRTLGLAH